LDQLILILKILFTFFSKTSYLNEEASRIESFPSVSVPWYSHRSLYLFKIYTRISTAISFYIQKTLSHY
jgi:hypothetical protein